MALAPGRSPQPDDPGLVRMQALARLLDSAIRIPGTRVRFGVDPLLGLIPGLGDVIAAALSGVIVLEAARRGVPISLLLRLTANVALDTLAGTIPLVGDGFDAAWKANQRNLALLQQHLHSPERVARSTRRLVWLAGGLMVGIMAAGAALAWLLLRWVLTWGGP